MEQRSKGPQLIAIAGANGAGKSTLAPYLLRDTIGLMEYVNADPIALGLSAFRPEHVAFEAGRVMLRRLEHLASQRASFAFETTLAGRSLAPWIRRLRQDGYKCHIAFVWVRSPDLAIRRVQERVKAGGHAVPEEVIVRRYHKGVRHFLELYCALAHTWAVYDNETLGSPVMVASGAGSGEPKIDRPDLWDAFREQARWR